MSKEKSVSAWGDPDKILAALAPYNSTAPRDIWASGQQMLVQVATQNGAASATIYQHLESGVAVAFYGRLDNRSDLIAQLDVGLLATDDELIALAWLKWGEHCPEKLIGDFAFAVSSPKNGVVFLARDVMGIKPLYYRADDFGIFFATTVAAFKPVTSGILTHSEEWSARYLLGFSQDNIKTAYLEISKLPNGHCLLYKMDGGMKIKRYHRFIDNAPMQNTKRQSHDLDAYREAWQRAIHARIPHKDMLATENSGGLDSASIAAEIAHQLGKNATHRMQGLAFCHEVLESEMIMATAQRYNFKQIKLYRDDICADWDAMRLRETAVIGYPLENAIASAYHPFYEYCQEQAIRTLFSGFAGDELTTYSGGIAARFERIDQHDWQGLWRMVSGSVPMRVARFAKFLAKAMLPTPHHNPIMVKAWQQRWAIQPFREDVVARYGLASDFFASASYDEGFRQINQAALHLISTPFVSTRFENCSLMAASYGVEYVWPLADQRLIQQWLATPSVWKVGDGGLGRYLHRSAIDDVCPDAITWKANKSMGGSLNALINGHVDTIQSIADCLQRIEALPTELDALINITKLKQQFIKHRNNGHLAVSALPLQMLQTQCALLCNLSAWIDVDGNMPIKKAP